MSCPTNEPYVDFSVLRTLKIDENIRNPLMFLRKMATCSCFAGPIDIKIHASMYFMSICPLAQYMMLGSKAFDPMMLFLILRIQLCSLAEQKKTDHEHDG